jgi:hypothetical protein
MPSLQLKLIGENTRYTHRQLVQLRRQLLRFARSVAHGAERNARRQVARSLRSLFRNKAWLDAHTVDGSQAPT